MAKAENIAGLDCEAGALDGINLVLGARLDEMCALREDALDWDNSEGVHDMRVASRRLRSALRDFLPHLRKKRVPQKRLKTVADALGDVRDEDVAIAALAKLAENAAEKDEDVVEGVRQLAAERGRRRDAARATLEGAIGEVALAKLRRKFIDRLGQATNVSDGRGSSAGEARTGASTTFRQIGRDIILARFNELDDLSASLYHPFATKPLHRMRIAAKRLRYAIELFAPCWGAPVAPFAEEVAELQESLGELHDCDVWIEDLGARLGRRLYHGNGAINVVNVADSQTRKRRAAAVWLVRYFLKERTKHFRDALARWHEWETTDFRARLTTTLDAAQTAPNIQPSTLSVTATVVAD